MNMINFGTGSIIAVPTNLADGTVIETPTPVKLAELTENSLDLSVDLQTLYGSGMYPIAVGQGKGKLELKAKTAKISGTALSSLYFGQEPTSGIKDIASASGTISSSALTVAPPNSGTFGADLGVYNSSTGDQYKRVAASPATGQYVVTTAGVYTFSADDVGVTVLIEYEYSSASSTGRVFAITNREMGYTPAFSLIFRTTYMGKTLTGKFYRGVSGKFSLPMKAGDFTISDFDAQFFANDADQVGWLCMQG